MVRLTLHPDFYEGNSYSAGEQKRLTEELLLPHRVELIADIRAVRSEVDAALRKDPEIQKRVELWGKEYPLGFCAEIRNAMLTRMHAHVQAGTRPGMRHLGDFVRAGGIVKPFWGIDQRMHFQNAIQIGDAVLDVANDTVDAGKDPIEFHSSIEASPLKPITAIEEFAHICEKYWHYDVYPNIYFPQYAPAYPLLALMHARRGNDEQAEVLMMPVIETELARLNLYTLADECLFGSAYDFLFRSRYRDKRLPGPMLKLLVKTQPSAIADASGREAARAAFERLRVSNTRAPLPVSVLEEAEYLTQSGKPLAGVILAGIHL